MPYVGQKPADIISTAVDTVTGKFSGEVDAASLDISGNIDVDGTTNLDVVDIDGAVDINAQTNIHSNLVLDDNNKVIIGNGSDLQLYHNASNSYIQDVGTGKMHITSNGTGVSIDKGTSENMATFDTDGAVSLFHNAVKKFETTSTGVSVTGNVVVPNGNGIDFSATGDGAGTDTSELFSDYEEGTFTPTLAYTTAGNSSFGYAAQHAHYVKVGDIVHFQLNIRLNAFTKGTGSGVILVPGLPYTSHNTGGFANSAVNVQLYGWPFSNIPIASVVDNTNYAALNAMSSNAVIAALSDPDSNAMVWLSGTYRAA